ncbi:MAG: tryptophan transporter [Erysipelotrichaceae bacterium]
MHTKTMAINAILIAVGAILHYLTPTFGLAMQPDLLLLILIWLVVLNQKNYQTSLSSALVCGLFAALSTKFPGGQLPNIIDKLVSMQLIYVCVRLTIKRRQDVLVHLRWITPLVTLFSGTIFLLFAALLVGLPAGFSPLWLSVVLPTAILNGVIGLVFLPVLFRISKTFHHLSFS